MKRSLLIFSTFLLAYMGCNSPEQKVEPLSPYQQKVTEHREMVKNYFTNPESSPLEKKDLQGFQDLNYFPIDSTWLIKGELVPDTTPDMITLVTTTGTQVPAAVIGQIYFEIKGAEYVLNGYHLMGSKEGNLFIPFLDETNEKESYGGGRYLEAYWAEGNVVWLDFNMAYNPYCVYNTNYSCPIPPQDNFIPEEIKAGEKNYKMH